MTRKLRTAVCLLFAATTAVAGPINFSFSPPVLNQLQGDVFNVSIGISGLQPNGVKQLALSSYDINIFFDPSLLVANSVIFGDPKAGNQLDLSGFGSLQMSDFSIAGQVNLVEISLDSPTTLATQQLTSFTVASLNFTALSTGVSPLSFSLNSVGDAIGNNLPVGTNVGSVTIGQIPEPGTLLLGVAGLAGFGLLRRRS